MHTGTGNIGAVQVLSDILTSLRRVSEEKATTGGHVDRWRYLTSWTNHYQINKEHFQQRIKV